MFFEETVLAYDGDECLIWPYSKSSHGYGQLLRNGRLQYVSRMACEEANGPPPTAEHQAAHSCGKGHLGCVAKRHLSWKTRSENEMDKVEHGTSNRGERHGMSKLTSEEVLEIRRLEGLVSRADIARMFNVSARQVLDIHKRKNWGWLNDDTHVPPVGGPYCHEGKAA